jgi:20S proteasome alpha/beta subunit
MDEIFLPYGQNISSKYSNHMTKIFLVAHKFMFTSSSVSDIEYIVNTFNHISNLYSSHYNNNPLTSKGDMKVC